MQWATPSARMDWPILRACCWQLDCHYVTRDYIIKLQSGPARRRNVVCQCVLKLSGYITSLRVRLTDWWDALQPIETMMTSLPARIVINRRQTLIRMPGQRRETSLPTSGSSSPVGLTPIYPWKGRKSLGVTSSHVAGWLAGHLPVIVFALQPNMSSRSGTQL